MLRSSARVFRLIPGVTIVLLAGLVTRAVLRLGYRFDLLLGEYAGLRGVLLRAGMEGSVQLLVLLASFVAFICLLVGVAAILFPTEKTLSLLRASCWLFYGLFLYWFSLVLRFSRLPSVHQVELAGAVPDAVTVFFWRWAWLRTSLLGVWVVLAVHVLLRTTRMMQSFGASALSDEPPFGDLFLESLRTHGRDPAYRKSLWSSIGTHVMVILVLPWLLSLRGCIEPYRIPKGSGQPELTVVQVVRTERQQRRFLLNPNSAISFRVPDLDDSGIEREVQEITQLTYQADASRVGGALGAGGGETGGWPDGMEDATVRFIRLEYHGAGWDDGMDSASRSDRNFLEFFRQTTGFRTAGASESHPISDLSRYPPGLAPPFVYMTGHGNIRIPERDIRILREYLTNGGMLFADCGSPQWHNAFVSLMRAVFPGEPLRQIADDDPIFQFPYRFPNGAPPLWHHGGRKAMGIRYRGRWAVFYHPGDLKDAWRTGHSGLAPHLARSASELGINIVYYAFTHYLEQTRSQRR